MSDLSQTPEIPGQEPSRTRKKYEPPRVAKISLRPEEAVLGHCKNASVAGPVSFSCSAVGNCQTIGS
jgi:hypothetical protein